MAVRTPVGVVSTLPAGFDDVLLGLVLRSKASFLSAVFS
jgi:hypothetical protein